MATTEKTEKKTKGMCIATRCTSVEQFIQMFHRFVDEESFFVSTLNTRPPGLETSFSVQLVDGTPVLRGLCVVMQAWTDANNPFRTPGVRLGIKRLTANSMAVFERLLVTRSATKPAPFGPNPSTTNGAPQAVPPIATKPGGVPAPKLPAAQSSLAVVVAVPRSIPKSPFSETAPTKHAPSRLELKQPVRPSTAPGTVRPPIATPPTGTPMAKPEPVVAKSEPSEHRRPEPPPTPAKLQPSALLAKREQDLRDELTPTPIPDPIPPETTDLNDGPTDVREPRKMVRDLAVMDTLRAIETPAQIAAEPDLPRPVPDDARTPGSELVLPANPLMNMTDESLAGYVECTLYEETGNFFPVDDPEAIVDDVVGPPPPLRARAQTPPPIESETPVTPLPPAPAVPAEDFDDPISVAAPYQTQPKAAAYDSATESQRAGSPSIVVPPAVPAPAHPKESVMVDPALIARGSMPAFDGGAYDKSGNGKLGLPLPAPNRSSDRLQTTRKSGVPWLMFGAIGLLAAAGAVAIVMMSSGSGDADATAPPPKLVQDVAQVAPPVPDKSPEGSGTTPVEQPDEAEEPAPGEGPPIVGAGPCSVVVNTTPAGSIIALDDVKVGPSPMTVAATCAVHTLDISHARYQSATKQITLAEGKPQAVEVTLQRPTHIVTVTSNPSGATIFIDGRRAGTTPTKLSVLGFVTVELEFKKTGFQPAEAKLYSRVPQDQVGVRLNKW